MTTDDKIKIIEIEKREDLKKLLDLPPMQEIREKLISSTLSLINDYVKIIMEVEKNTILSKDSELKGESFLDLILEVAKVEKSKDRMIENLKHNHMIILEKALIFLFESVIVGLANNEERCTCDDCSSDNGLIH